MQQRRTRTNISHNTYHSISSSRDVYNYANTAIRSRHIIEDHDNQYGQMTKQQYTKLLKNKDIQIRQLTQKIQQLQKGIMTTQQSNMQPILITNTQSYFDHKKQVLKDQLPAVLMPGVYFGQNKRAKHPYVNSEELPHKIGFVSGYKGIAQNWGKESEALGLIIPIAPQFGKLFRGKRLDYGENMRIANDPQYRNLKQLYNLKGKSNYQTAQAYEKKKLLQQGSEILGNMEGYLYVTDDVSPYTQKQFDYHQTLIQHQNALLQKDIIISSLQQRLRTIDQRQQRFQNQILSLQEEIINKNTLIKEKQLALTKQTGIVQQLLTVINGQTGSKSSRQLSDIHTRISQIINLPNVNISSVKSYIQSMVDRRDNKFLADTNMKKLLNSIQGADTEKNLQSKNKILEHGVESWILGLPETSPLKRKLIKGEQRERLQTQYADMVDKLRRASAIYKQQIQQIRKDNPFLVLNVNENVLNLLSQSNTRVKQFKDIIQIEKHVNRTVEVPTYDERTKALIKLLTFEMNKLLKRHPKLYKQVDTTLTDYLQKQLTNRFESEQIQRLVSIVKYVPQVVKVENIYTYSSEKTRKTEFHLRILIKTLLDELLKIKQKTNIQLQIDESVLNMVRQEVIDLINVEDVLRVFKPVQRIVEVQKIVEIIKPVQRYIQVPVYQNTVDEYPVAMVNNQIIEQKVHVPVQVQSPVPLLQERFVKAKDYNQRVVFYPQIKQKPVQHVRQVPQIHEIQKIRQKIIEVVRVQTIPQQIRQVPVYRQYPVDRQIKEFIVQEKIIDNPYEVKCQVEKLVERIVQVPKIIKQQRVQYIERKVPQIVQRQKYIIQKQIEPVDRIRQKAVPVVEIVNQIYQIQRIVEKPVFTVQQVQTIKEVQKFVDRVLYEDKLIQVKIEKPVIQRKQIPKIIEKIREVPVITEVIKEVIVPQYIPLLQHTRELVHVDVILQKPIVLFQDVIKEVQKPFYHTIEKQKPYKVTQEKIVPISRIIKQPFPFHVIHEKIVQKIVQVPKVIQVQKIVEKIVVVPRIVEKIVEVPKIVQVPVQTIVEVQKIVEIQKFIQVPVIQEKEVYIERVRIEYITIPYPIYIQPEQILRTNVRQIITQQPVYIDKIVNHIQKQLEFRQVTVQKIVPIIQQVTQFVDQQVLVSMTRQVPVPVIVQKPVQLVKIIQRPVAFQKLVEKIVVIPEIRTQIKEVQVIVTQFVTNTDIKIVPERFPVIEEKIIKVQVPVYHYMKQQVIKQVKTTQQKFIKAVQKIREPYAVIKEVHVPYQVPKIVPIERIVNRIVQVPKIYELITEKIVELPYIVNQLKEIMVSQQRLIPGGKEIVNQFNQITNTVQRELMVQKLSRVTQTITKLQQSIQMHEPRTRSQKRQPVSVLLTEQRIVEVPVIVEKIVEKIVMMPQIVEVLKYVHEVIEEDTVGVAVSEDIGVQELRYKSLGKNLKGELDRLTAQLKKLKNNPNLRTQIQLIQSFLQRLQSFIQFSRIHEVIRQVSSERIIERDNLVQVPVEHKSLPRLILIQKLISQIKRLKKQNPALALNLDDEILNIFFNNERMQLTEQMRMYTNQMQRQFRQRGGWNNNQQQMLKTFLNDKIDIIQRLRNVNRQLQSTKDISEQRRKQIQKLREEKEDLLSKIGQLIKNFNILPNQTDQANTMAALSLIKDNITYLTSRYSSQFRVRNIDPQDFLNLKWHSTIREKDQEILKLRSMLRQGYIQSRRTIQSVRRQPICQLAQHDQFRNRINELQHILSQRNNEIRQMRTQLMQSRQTQRRISSQSRQVVIEKADHSKCNDTIRKQQRQLNAKQQEIRLLHRQLNSIKQKQRDCREKQAKKIQQIRTLQQRIAELQREIQTHKSKAFSIGSSPHTKASLHSPRQKVESQDYGKQFFQHEKIRDSEMYQQQTIQYEFRHQQPMDNSEDFSGRYIQRGSITRQSGVLSSQNPPSRNETYQSKYQKKVIESSRISGGSDDYKYTTSQLQSMKNLEEDKYLKRK